MYNREKQCPYCSSKRLQIIGAETRPGYRTQVFEVQYKCLENENHIFKVCNYNSIIDKFKNKLK